MAGDFDPEEYDKQMAAAFGDDYYDAVSCSAWLKGANSHVARRAGRALPGAQQEWPFWF